MSKTNAYAFRYGMRFLTLSTIASGVLTLHHFSTRPKPASVENRPTVSVNQTAVPASFASGPQAQAETKPSKDGLELMAAIDANNYPLAKRLIKKNPVLASHNYILGRALNMSSKSAVYRSPIPFLKLLFDNGAELNPKIKEGVTTPLAATAYGDPECTRFLLKRGARVDAKNSDGDTALIIAAGVGNTEVVRILLQHGAKVDASNGRALLRASNEGKVFTVQLLLQYGANIHLQDNDVCSTPLWLAAHNGHLEVVDCLIRHGANVNLHNKWGDSALEIAENIGDDKIIDRLKKAGAKEPVYNKSAK